MIKFLRYTEYLYLAVAVISLYKIGELWNLDRNQAYIFVFFAVVSIAMFFFRRNYRRRFEKRRDEENR